MITVDWTTKVISVPQSYLTFTSGLRYELDVNQFRLDLKDTEDDPSQGMVYPDTHRHNTEVTLAGVTFARTFEIINGYVVEFEEGTYSVSLAGANNNIADVTVVNSVSVQVNNSAGLIVTNQGSGLSAEQAAQLRELWQMHGLQLGNPMTVTPTSRQTQGGEIDQIISGDGENTSTVTRQP